MTTQYVLPYPRFRGYYPGTNIPLVGGKLYTLQPGTTGLGNLKATYNDATGATPNANPVILDSNGEADIFGLGFYKLVLFDSLNNQIFSKDNIGLPAVGGGGGITGEWIDSGLTPTFITSTSFSFTGNQTALFIPGMRLKSSNNGGIVYSTIVSSVYTSVTTITVINDGAGVLDAGISSVTYGIVSPQSSIAGINHSSSFPINPVLSYTTSQNMNTMDNGQIITFNSGGAVAYTLLAANLVPPGFSVRIFNLGAGVLTLTGTVNGIVNPAFGGLAQIYLASNGTTWYGIPISPISDANAVPVRNASKDLLDRNGNPLFSAGVPTSSTSTATATTQLTVAVTAGDVLAINSFIGWTVGGGSLALTQLTSSIGAFLNGTVQDTRNVTVGSSYNVSFSAVLIANSTGAATITSFLASSGGATGITNSLGYAFLKKQ